MSKTRREKEGRIERLVGQRTGEDREGRKEARGGEEEDGEEEGEGAVGRGGREKGCGNREEEDGGGERKLKG